MIAFIMASMATSLRRNHNSQSKTSISDNNTPLHDVDGDDDALSLLSFFDVSDDDDDGDGSSLSYKRSTRAYKHRWCIGNESKSWGSVDVDGENDLLVLR
jgi:hypothetical protein